MFLIGLKKKLNKVLFCPNIFVFFGIYGLVILRLKGIW